MQPEEGLIRKRQDIVILAFIVLAVFWVKPYSGDLRGDALTYACISKDIAINGHWFQPHLLEIPYHNKPPLYFWIVAIFYKIFGVGYYTTKLPSLLFATIDVFLLYRIVFVQSGNRELAFFTSAVFITTRWIFRNFTTNRPESLLVFFILLGWYSLIQMESFRKKGSLLLGFSFAGALMSKLFFAFLIPVLWLNFAITKGLIRKWLQWKYLWLSLLIAIVLGGAWFFYYETNHPGYIKYLVQNQTLQRITTGLDTKKSSLMYVKEFLTYYHPWIIFLVIGLVSTIKQKNKFLLYCLLTVFAIFIPLQISTGKASRYLVPLTPFLSVITAAGVVSIEKAKRFLTYLLITITTVFMILVWTTPLKIRPEKFRVLHLAERISTPVEVDYRDPFAFLGGSKHKRQDIRFVEWSSRNSIDEYTLSFYFYLSETFQQWSEEELTRWAASEHTPVVLLTRPESVPLLPTEHIQWITIDADQYHVLLFGIKNTGVSREVAAF